MKSIKDEGGTEGRKQREGATGMCTSIKIILFQNNVWP